MRRKLRVRIRWALLLALAPVSLAGHAQGVPDFPGAVWVRDPDVYVGRYLGSADYTVEYIVILASGGATAEGAVSELTQQADKSLHYLIANGKGPKYKDGQVIQMVREQDTSWSIGIWPLDSSAAHRGRVNNFNVVSIELVGLPNEKGWCTEATYASAAKLVKYLADKYGIPITRDRILGHDEAARLAVPPFVRQDPCGATSATCTFNWSELMSLAAPGSASASQPAQTLSTTPSPMPAPSASSASPAAPSSSPAPQGGGGEGLSQLLWPIVIGTLTLALLFLALTSSGIL